MLLKNRISHTRGSEKQAIMDPMGESYECVVCGEVSRASSQNIPHEKDEQDSTGIVDSFSSDVRITEMETDALSPLHTEQDSDYMSRSSGSMSQIVTPPQSPGNSACNEINYTHFQRASRSPSMYMCDICHAKFLDISSMNMHVNALHPPLTEWKCHDCYKIFMTVRSLCRHKKKEHKKDMRCRMNTHDPKGDKYRCSECFQGFPGYEEVESHMKNMHDTATPKMHVRFYKKKGVWNFITKYINYVKSKIETYF
jgi:DNA-directed RNA polymerase subunit RPC12/RpoP